MTPTQPDDVTFTLYRSAQDNEGTRVSLPWNEWCSRYFSEHAVRGTPADIDADAKTHNRNKNGECIVLGVVNGRRAKANVTEVGGVALDLDNLPEARTQEVLAILKPFEFMCWTTHKHGARVAKGCPRLRVLLPFAAPISPADHARAWAGLNQLVGGVNDPATKDVSRLHFLPSTFDVSLAETYHNEGQWLTLEALPLVEVETARAATAGDHAALLARHGWALCGESGDNEKWTRPGKDSDTSATWHRAKGVFFCFTSSAPPLEAQKGYSLSALRMALEPPAAALNGLTLDGVDVSAKLREFGARCAGLGKIYRAVARDEGIRLLKAAKFQAPSKLIDAALSIAGGEGSGESAPVAALLGAAIKKAHRIIAAHGDLLVYIDGVYLPRGEEVVRLEVQNRLGLSASMKLGDETVYWLENNSRVDASLLDSERRINFSNGLLDWQTGEFQPHSPEVFTTVQIPTPWDPAAYFERGDRFLDEVLPDASTRETIEEFLGYCLLPDCRFQRALMLTGEGANGKSVFLDWLIASLGADNTSSVKLQDLDHRFRAADLAGKLANVSADLPRATLEDSGPLKMLVVGDELQAERKHKAPFKFRNRAKLLFSANEIPGAKDRSDAFFRRWLVVPFPHRFDASAPDFDPFITSKLVGEPGRTYLLRLAVTGLQRLVARGGFRPSNAMTDALGEYRQAADNIVAWYSERGSYDEKSNTPKGHAYSSYRMWCGDNGQVPANEVIFAKRLKTIEPRLVQVRPRPEDSGNTGRLRFWKGLALETTTTSFRDLRAVPSQI